MKYKCLLPGVDLKLLAAMEGEHRSHLVARLRAATSVDTKYSKLLGNKGLCRKLAFCQLNYSRSAGTSNYSKEMPCPPRPKLASLRI